MYINIILIRKCADGKNCRSTSSLSNIVSNEEPFIKREHIHFTKWLASSTMYFFIFRLSMLLINPLVFQYSNGLVGLESLSKTHYRINWICSLLMTSWFFIYIYLICVFQILVAQLWIPNVWVVSMAVRGVMVTSLMALRQDLWEELAKLSKGQNVQRWGNNFFNFPTSWRERGDRKAWRGKTSSTILVWGVGETSIWQISI